MRSVWCGLLLVAISAFPAAGQAPDGAAWPSLEEARSSSRCDGTSLAKVIADIKAADPEQDADKQIAAGDFSLKTARAIMPVPKVAALLMPERARPDAPGPVAPDTPRKSDHTRKFVTIEFALQPLLAGVQCKLNVRAAEAFPIPYVEVRTADDASKRCGRAVLVLAADYASRFNRRVVADPAYPHKDVCAVGPASGTGPAGRISDRPTPDMIPAQIPDIATAARFGLTEHVAKFVADGADVAQRDVFGFDALKWAVARDYRQAFDLIMAAGGNPDFCGALKAAVEYDRAGTVAPLAQRCAPERRLELLDLAASRGWIDVVKALIDTEPALYLADAEETISALWSAVSAGRVELAQLLLDRISTAQWEKSQQGLLRTAVEARNMGMLRLLLERGGDPAPGLRLAVHRRSHEVVRTLAAYGADLNAALPQQPQKVAAANVPFDPVGRRQPAQWPPGGEKVSRLADPPIFMALDLVMDIKMVDLLLQLGADPNARDARGRTPLMVAITYGQIYGKKDGVAWIERYVPRRLIAGQEDWEHRGVEPVRALLAKGADVAQSDRDGLTALHHAARSDYNLEIVRILLAHGADINALDASGKTPLDHALEGRLVRMPEALTAAGARKGSR